MKKIFSILFALALMVSLVMVMTAPVLADSSEVTPGWTHVDQVAAGHRHTVGLISDGTVVAVGATNEGQCDVSDWSEIEQIAAGGYHTVGLRLDSTAVAAGPTYDGRCDVDDWTDIDQVAAGGWHTVGLESDGTVVAVGDNYNGQCEISSWSNIKEIAAGGLHTVGLVDDGTVVAEGDNYNGQCNVGNLTVWSDIIHVAAGYEHTVGLKSDGTVVAVGNNDYGQCDVDEWTDIVQIAAGETQTVGLTSDGMVVAVGDDEYHQCDVDSWTDITQVTAGYYHTVSVTSDGAVVAVGDNTFGQCGEGVLHTIVNGGIIDALTEADCIVEVTGAATLVIFKYDSNPHPDSPMEGVVTTLNLLADKEWIDLSKWIEIKPVSKNSSTEILIKLYYKDDEIDAAEADSDVEIDRSSLRIRWYDPAEGNFVDCEPEGDVVAEPFGDYSGYMWVRLKDSGTRPTLEEAQQSLHTFGGYAHPSEDFDGCGAASLADVTPFALVSVGIIAVWATKRKGKVS